MLDEFKVLRKENTTLREENARLRTLVANLLPLKDRLAKEWSNEQ